MIYLNLFLEFFKTGLFAVGGGLATLPFLREISVNHPDWYSLKELSNMVAVANATPGPIGVNMATYVGFTTSGILGSLVATLSLVLPSFVIILIVSGILEKFKSSIYVEGVFKGLRPAVVALILIALLQLSKEVFIKEQYTGILDMFSIKHILLFAGFYILTKLDKKNRIVLFIILGALAGILLRL